MNLEKLQQEAKIKTYPHLNINYLTKLASLLIALPKTYLM